MNTLILFALLTVFLVGLVVGAVVGFVLGHDTASNNNTDEPLDVYKVGEEGRKRSCDHWDD